MDVVTIRHIADQANHQASCGADPIPQDARIDDSLGDAALIRRSAGGDMQAFDQLAQRHERAAFGLAMRILRNREDAEDAVQEAFVRAWRAMEQCDPERGFRSWVLKIAANCALTLRARRHPFASLDDDNAPDFPDRNAVAPDRTAIGREMVHKLDGLVYSLAPEVAAVFQLRYAEQMSVEEVAQVVGQKPGTVAVTLHRLREKFRQALFGEKENTV